MQNLAGIDFNSNEIHDASSTDEGRSQNEDFRVKERKEKRRKSMGPDPSGRRPKKLNDSLETELLIPRLGVVLELDLTLDREKLATRTPVFARLIFNHRVLLRTRLRDGNGLSHQTALGLSWQIRFILIGVSDHHVLWRKFRLNGQIERIMHVMEVSRIPSFRRISSHIRPLEFGPAQRIRNLRRKPH